MDLLSIFDYLIYALIAIVGWFVRILWDASQKLKEDLHQIELDLPNHYLRKDDFKESFNELRKDLHDNFKRIFEVLDHKADK